MRLDEPANRVVVAAIVAHRGQICLLRRSQRVSSDRGLWHCITGYLDPECDPVHQTSLEIFEETGLTAGDLLEVRRGPELTLTDAKQRAWRVIPYWVEVARLDIQLNWENDSYRWIGSSHRLPTGTVSWLPSVLDAVGVGHALS